VIGAPSRNDQVHVLGIPADARAYAHDLYRMLRAADAVHLDRVIAVRPDAGGIGAAVDDRLRRAAGTGAAS
jgi:hypothetical protein